MDVIKWGVVALAVAAASSQPALANQQSQSNGFIEDSSLDVLTRVLYFNRDYKGNRNAFTINGNRVNRSSATGLGFIGELKSGFTQGTVGLGVDAIGLQGIRLDGGRGQAAGTGMFPIGNSGDAAHTFSKGGAAIKARISNTTVKFGTQFTELPVFSTDDLRLLPETTTGTLITSNEIDGLELHAGYFTALSAQNVNRHDSIELLRAKVLGGSYQFNDALSASLYASDVDLAFKKYYGNLNYALALSEDQALNFDFNIYRTHYDKEYTETGGSERNTIWSLASTYSFGPHAVMAAYQKSHGGFDGIGYDYGYDGGGTVWLANSVQYSDFNGQDEKSWQLRYDFDFAELGVPGLTFMTRYISGSNARTPISNNAKEWERDIEVGYTVQSGAAKDLNLRVRQATYRSSDGVYYGAPSADEIRVIFEYPLSFL